MEQFKFYCENKPTAGEIVQVVFTERKEDHTEGFLTEYEGNIIMVHAQATKKKKIKSFNKIIPLDKPLAAVIEDFSDDKNNGSVSRAYLDLPEEEYSRKFNNNSKLINGIYQICIKLNINFEDIWRNKLFPYFQKSSVEGKSYLENFMECLELPDEILDNKELKDAILEKFSNLSNKKEVFKKDVGIISNNGVEGMKSVISNSFDEVEDKERFNIKYKNAPNFTIETDISEEALDKFIEIIVKNSKSIDNVFVKTF